MTELKKTPLNEAHRKLGAKMVPFGGWDMPVQYTGIIAEHEATRNAAGLFDVSHMGEIFVTGRDTIPFLEKTTCNNVAAMVDGQVQYNAILNADGGLVDDVTLYRFSPERIMVCSNASNYDSVYAHLLKIHSGEEVEISNESDKWHQIAIQGPKAEDIAVKVLGDRAKETGYYRFYTDERDGELIVSRTGYTGEDGYEIYSTIKTGLLLWDELLAAGQDSGLLPVGLGARDTLRLEAKYPLYGHELNETRSPVESGIGWIVKEKEIPFYNYEKIIAEKKEGPSRNVAGIQMTEQGIIRENYRVFSVDGQEIGVTTSGGYSPTLKTSIGLVYIDSSYIKDGEPVEIEIRQNRKKAKIVKGKFIEGSAGKKGK